MRYHYHHQVEIKAFQELYNVSENVRETQTNPIKWKRQPFWSQSFEF